MLNSSANVALIFGDRDFRCNWIGAEETALAAKYPHATQFAASGYETLATNKTYNGGVVKQYGSFSFSRVFDAGHSVGVYQPETVYNIFMRTMFEKDVATGKKGTKNYSSKGPASSLGIRNVLPSPAPTTCVVNGTYQKEPLPVFVDLFGKPPSS
jgi:hypothetical protein